MEFNNIEIHLKILREEETFLKFQEPLNINLNLSNESVEDIQHLFNSLFEFIVENQKIPTFTLQDDSNDLFFEVAKDIEKNLNIEVQNSKNDFEKIIELKSEISK
ncbi:hypothetical protein [Staphylococcus epidermidis]|uniref:hypothetical protein n=1 Tax=Staphylococcus epidermidis TaxID=1282 RepID=UPI00035531AB|nr:hypothetical protein [Staphylococcus epidermidis]MDU2710064.1 hypothetical protein [Finegoldia magna]EPP69433.1 hypothetical protein M458_01265 [Staphylococcus epidermidis Scl22]ESR04153.1 hypothetical protein M462_0212440 [Staphylococcus epidermidis CIM28]ESR27601.1 hypothetical protein M452_0203085 [Staphylococcus epidermidis APO35]ESU04286.1 hypothetical protein M461_0204185 [Staphylococcus epidermidis CIM37]